MKIFIFAVQCAGKTTLANYLRKSNAYQVIEMDDEILRLNGNVWPTDFQYKITDLEPAVYGRIEKMQDVIFMDNHLALEQASKFKRRGFSIIYIEVERDILLQRNKERVQSSDQDDASQWIDSELENAKQLIKNGLVDKIIDGDQSTQEITDELLAYDKR